MLIGLGMNVFFPFACKVKYAIPRHAPLDRVTTPCNKLAIVRRCALSVAR
jgi:hypothetical protein